MTEQTVDFKLPKFDGDRASFPLWKSKLLMYLDTIGLEEYATGEFEDEDLSLTPVSESKKKKSAKERASFAFA